MGRVILHCDMNNYFAAVAEKFNPSLKKIPFAVCGNPAMRHNIVMSKNSLAKQAGVLTGLSFRQALEICPNLAAVAADYPSYLNEAKTARKIYQKYTDTILPYGLDESWVDLTETGATLDEGRQIADLIRLEIFYSQGLSASVGVSDNLIYAKLGSDMGKPNTTTVISRENLQKEVWPLPAASLLFVGEARKNRLAAVGIQTIGNIAQAGPEIMGKLLGKAGVDLWRFANGNDDGFRPDNDTIGSIGNTITPPQDLHTAEDVSALLYVIASAVSARLQKHGLKAACLSVTMKDSHFHSFSRQNTELPPTNNRNCLFNRAFALFSAHYPWRAPLRSVGIRAENLIPQAFEQLSLFEIEDDVISVDIDGRVKRLTARFGPLQLEKSAALREG